MLDDLICRFAHPLGQFREPFWRLVHAVRASSRLLIPSSERGSTDLFGIERVVRGCARMARHSDAWQRPPEVWIAPVATSFVQFRSLVSHLFDEYPVPNFMAPVWISDDENPRDVDLYLHLASGHSIRQFQWPVPIGVTRQAALFFMQAPDDLNPSKALRWGQIRSLGGDNRLARLLVSRTILGNPTEHEDFWESVIRFLITNSQISAEEILAIVRFVDQQRFQPAETVWGEGAGQQPLQPEFTIGGRSLMSLRRHMANWRTELMSKLPALTQSTPGWERTNIGPFRQAQGDLLWTIDELLSDRELRVEGGIMKHCVATYIHDCACRRTSIWSMKIQQGERRQRVLTVEVLPGTKMIWQAKGKLDAPPSEAAELILHRWADQEGLRFRKMV